MSEPIILTPNAPTMLNSLRALGYSFNTAVADIVDNSIAAGADRVDVSLGGGEGESPFLAISDNGRGMDAEELREAMRVGGIDRIMFDNFTPEQTREAVAIVDHRCETESSGGITFDTIRSYAECGVDFISVGALTHSVKGLDMSFKAC